MSTTAINQLMDTVNAIGFDRPEDFVEDANCLLAMALAMLPAAQREEALREIEGGILRQMTSLFGKPSYPKVSSGNGGLQ
jgi:hypothetical protein